MTKRPTPIPPSRRDAPALWGGVRYQKLVTLHAWLDLREGELLFIELGEDFLRHDGASGAATQVRGTQRPLSLADVGTRQIIEAAFARPIDISTVYWSTSPPGREQGLYRKAQVSGVELWARAAGGDLSAIKLLRTYLVQRGGWSEPLASALRDAGDEALRVSLFARIRWDLAKLSTALLESQAKAKLTVRIGTRSLGPAHVVDNLLPRCLDQIETVARHQAADERHLDLHRLEREIEDTLVNAQNLATLSASVGPTRSTGSIAGLADLLAQAHRTLGAAIAGDLEAARDDLVRGRIRGAIDRIDRWTTDDTLDRPSRAAALRLRAEASLLLGAPGDAADLERRAHEFDGAGDPRLRVRILAATDPEAALTALGSNHDDPWLQAELLVRLGRGAEARALVDGEQAADTSNAARVHALAHGATGDISGALNALAPFIANDDSVDLRGVAATLHFAAAQAPGVRLSITPWPAPTHSGLVQRSAAAAEHLSRAADLFRDVAAALDDPTARANRLVWRLGCLVDLAGREGDAQRLIVDLLARDPPHPGAVHWALARGVAFDETDVEAHLRAATRADAETLAAIATLMRLRGANAEAIALLSARLPALADADRPFIEAWIEQLRTDVDANPLLAALARGRARGDWDPLETIAAAPAEPAHRLMALQMLGREGQWAAVLRRRDFLVSLKTPDALLLAATALHNADLPGEALALVDDNLAAFGPAGLPDDVVGLKIECLIAVGRLAEAFALRDRSNLAPTSRAARMLGVRMNLNIGDLERVAVDAAQGRLDDLPAGYRLRIANQIAAAEPEAARRLLQTIDFEATDIELAPLAFEAAELASADTGIRQIIARRLFGGEARAAGIVQAVSIDDLLAQIHERAAAHQPDGYRTGEILIHREAGARIGRRLIRLLTDEGPAPDLFVRDAAAQAPRAIGAAALRLDAPAFLTAQALGLMPTLYAAFDRVEVSQHLPIALQQIERDLLGPQSEPSRPAAQTLAVLEAAVIDGAVSVTTGTLEGDPPSESDITAGLIALGQLTPARAAALGFDLSTIADHRPLPSGEPLHLAGQVLAAVASAGLLPDTLATWPVTIDAETLAAVRREADGERRTRAAAQGVGALRRTIVDDIRNDRLQSLPRQTNDEATANAVLESLRDLRTPGGAVIWTEDRAIDLRSDIDGIPVVEAYDVIAHLRGHGHLNAAQATEAMRRLRDAGFRFLPIEVDELLTLFRAAPIVAHAVVETRELAAVRRAFARDLLQESALRLAPDAEMKTAENKFVLRAFRLFDDALRRIWSGRDAVAKKRAWSDWLCVALGCERLDRAPLAAPDEASRRNLYEIHLASRVSLGYVIGGSRKARESAFEWVWARLLAPEFEADAALGANVRTAFATFWSEPFFDEDGTRPADTADARRERAAICAAGLSHMPEKMRDFLLAEPRLRAFVEAGFKRRLSVGSLTFPADSVLDAAIAVSGSNGAVRHLEPDDGARLTVRAVGESVDITSEASSTIARLAGDQLALVVGDLDARTAAAERLLTAAEAPAGSDDAVRLAALKTPYDRLVALHEIEADTIGGRLEEIVRLAAAGRLTVESLAPPPPAALRHWWRWPAGASIDPKELQAVVGGEWIARIAAAPLRAWSTFETAADADSAALRDVHSRLVSPLGELARLTLIAKDSAPEEIRAEFARVIDRFKVDGDDFVDLVGLFQRQADLDSRWRAEAPDFTALAMWAWTDLVWRALAQSGHVPSPLAAFWRKVVGRRPRDMVVEARAAVASAPPWTGAGRLLAMGLAVALGSRREEVWTEALTGDVARFVLDAARKRGPVAVGPLTLAPDRSLTWLADASPFIWLASGDLAAAIDDALENYPQDEAKMAALVLAGPDVIHPEAASRLVAKLADLWCDGRPGVPDRWVAELQYLGVALKSFVRRGALDIGERERTLALFETILATLTRHGDWNRLREGVYHFVFNHVLAVSVDALAAFLTRTFECARELERRQIMEIAAIYLAGLPFEERGPLWRAHLEMRARR